VSSAMDTSVGLSVAATLAALLDTANPQSLNSGSPSSGSDSPGPSGGSLAHGLGSRLLLAADVTRSPLVPRDGSIPVGRVEVDRDLLSAATKRLTPDRITWWHQRLRDAYPHLPLPPSFSR
jgi:O-succinylbenzoate synthase